MVYLHAPNINQISAPGFGIGKRPKSFRLAGSKIAAPFNIERKRVKASLLTSFREANRIKDPNRYIELLRAV